MRKGITPIISIIVLLLITIALAGVAWVYLSGMLGAHIETSFTIPPGAAYCTSGTITVVVTNTGTTTLATADFIVANIDGGAASTNAISLAPKEADTLISDDNGGAGWLTGDHVVDVSTAAGALSRTVVC